MSAPIDWSRFEIKETPSAPMDFSQYEIKEDVPQETPSLLKQFGQFEKEQASKLLRPVARTTETVLGLPRAGGEFLESIVPEKLIKKGAEKVGLKEPVEAGFKFAKKYAPYKLFPSSKQAREFGKSLFGDFLEPKNETQAIADEVVSDFATMAIPFGGPLKFARPALTALGAQATKQGAKLLGAGDETQQYAKLGTMVLGAFVQPGKANQLKEALYEQARQSRPANAAIPAPNTLQKVNNFENHLLKGDPGAITKTKSLDLLSKIRSKIQNNQLKLNELEEFKKDINIARSSLYEEFKGNKPGREITKRNLDSVSKIVDDALKEYGQQNPQWEAFYRPANEVHGAIAQSRKFRNWLSRNYKKFGLPGAAAVFGIEQSLGIPGTAAAAGVGYGALKSGEALARIWKSPTLRKYYTNVIQESLKENSPAMLENLNKLEAGLKKK